MFNLYTYIFIIGYKNKNIYIHIYVSVYIYIHVSLACWPQGSDVEVVRHAAIICWPVGLMDKASAFRSRRFQARVLGGSWSMLPTPGSTLLSTQPSVAPTLSSRSWPS